jgi:nicotinamide riboside transporter PnuC
MPFFTIENSSLKVYPEFWIFWVVVIVLSLALWFKVNSGRWLDLKNAIGRLIGE